jgi:hypothetical protein
LAVLFVLKQKDRNQWKIVFGDLCRLLYITIYFSLTWHHLDYAIYVEYAENRQDIAEILLKVALNTITLENVDLSIA